MGEAWEVAEKKEKGSGLGKESQERNFMANSQLLIWICIVH